MLSSVFTLGIEGALYSNFELISMTSCFCTCSYPLAMEFQKRVVDSWRNHGADARDELKEAMRLYNQIKAKALACLSPEGSANALPEPQEQETDSDTAKAVQR